MISFKHRGNFKNLERFLHDVQHSDLDAVLKHYGELGVEALRDSTPVDTGLTANSWYYTIEKTRSGVSITWSNSNRSDGIPIVVLIQYGHALPSGAYVPPNDFINPAIKPIFDEIVENLWREVSR